MVQDLGSGVCSPMDAVDVLVRLNVEANGLCLDPLMPAQQAADRLARQGLADAEADMFARGGCSHPSDLLCSAGDRATSPDGAEPREDGALATLPDFGEATSATAGEEEPFSATAGEMEILTRAKQEICKLERLLENNAGQESRIPAVVAGPESLGNGPKHGRRRSAREGWVDEIKVEEVDIMPLLALVQAPRGQVVHVQEVGRLLSKALALTTSRATRLDGEMPPVQRLGAEEVPLPPVTGYQGLVPDDLRLQVGSQGRSSYGVG